MTNPDSPSADATNPASMADVASAALATEQSGTPDDNQPAATSGAEEGANTAPVSLDDVIKAALKKDDPASATPADSDGSQEQPKADAVADADKVEKTEAEKDAEEDAKVPFHKHPRWQQKLEKERQLVAKVADLEQRYEPVSRKAEQLDAIGSFMRENELTSSEMTEGIQIMALMKKSPAEALAALMPKIELLELAAGKRLPSDIQEQVDAGEVSPSAAKELVQTRMLAQTRESEAAAARQQLESAQVSTTVTQFRAAADAFERDTAARDPDYQHKKSFVVDRFRVLAQQNPPATAEDVTALSRKAYEDVNTQMRAFVKPTATAPSAKSDQSSTRSASTPTSILDIVKQNIAR